MLLDHDPVHAFMPYPPVPVGQASAGPLSGLRFAVKDIFDVEGYRTGCGSPVKLAEAAPARAHAPPVAALLAAGARFVGKTHTEELAWSLFGTNAHFGTPINPAAPDRVPGGSSSGSASAVAAGLCDVALGSDTGGSVRAPASFCGLYGLRPTHGAISLANCMPLAASFDTAGFFARDAATLARAADVLLPGRSASAPGLRPLIARDLFARLAPAMREALEPTLSRLIDLLGAPQEIDLHAGPSEPAVAAFRDAQAFEGWAAHGAWVDRRRPVLGPSVAQRFAYARTVSAAMAGAAAECRASFAEGLADRMADGFPLIAPALHAPAPRLDSDQAGFDAYRAEAMIFLCPAGLAGLPQLVLPAGLLEGAPVGLSLIGPKGSDRALVALAGRLAQS